MFTTPVDYLYNTLMDKNNLVCRPLQINEEGAWDELVVASPQGNIFLTSEFINMIQETDLRQKVYRLGVWDGDRIVAGQAFFYQQRMGLAFPSALHFFYSGPLVRPFLPEQKRAKQVHDLNLYLSALITELSKHFAYSDLRLHYSLTDMRSFLWAGWHVEPRYTFLWDLKKLDLVRAEMTHGKREDLRRAQKNLVFAREEKPDVSDQFLKLYRVMVGKFDWLPDPEWERAFHLRLEWMLKRNLAAVYSAHTQNGELAALLITIFSPWNRTVYYWRQAYDAQWVNLGTVPGLYWYVAQQLNKEYEWVDFGDAGADQALGTFKDSLGTELKTYFKVTSPHMPVYLRLAEIAKQARSRLTHLKTVNRKN